MKEIELINHYLISNGTQYSAEKGEFEGTVKIRGPDPYNKSVPMVCGIYIIRDLLPKLEKCASTKEVNHLINTEWITH